LSNKDLALIFVMVGIAFLMVSFVATTSHYEGFLLV